MGWNLKLVMMFTSFHVMLQVFRQRTVRCFVSSEAKISVYRHEQEARDTPALRYLSTLAWCALFDANPYSIGGVTAICA